MNTTIAGIHQITAREIAALRTADRIYLRYDRASDATHSHIEAVKDPGDTSPWSQSCTIPCATSFECYDYDSKISQGTAHLYQSPGYSTLGTLLDLLKVGDDLTIRWIAQSHSHTYGDVTLVSDAVGIIIHRKKPIYLLLDYCTLHPASAARICRLEPRY